MKTSRFKTNAKCGGCVSKIEEFLNKIVDRERWVLDLESPDKVLEVTSDVPDEKIIEQVKKAGYKAEKLH